MNFWAVRAGGHRGLGRAVRVEHPYVRRPRLPGGQRRGRDGLPAEDQQAQRREGGGGAVGEREGKLRPVRRRQVQDGDPVPLDHQGDLRGQPLLVRPDHQGGPAAERGQQLVQRGVEREGREGEHPVPGGDPELLAGGGDMRVDRAVLDADGLGTAGGARGEDDVREVPRVGGVVRGARIGSGVLHPQHLRAERAGQFRGRPIGEDAGQPGLPGHEPQPLLGERRIQRYVDPAGPPDRGHRDHGPDPAPDAHADRGPRADARRAQGGGQPAAEGVQLAVAQDLLPAHQGHRVRLARHGERLRGRCGASRARHPDQAGPLLAGQRLQASGEFGHRGLRRGRHGAQQLHVPLGEADHRAPVEQGGGELEPRRDVAIGAQAQVEEHVQRGARQRGPHQADVQIVQSGRRRDGVQQGEGGLRERVAGQVALGDHLADHPVERGLGVREVPQGPRPYPAQQAGEGRIAGQVGAQHDRVHERADQRGHFGAPAVGQGGAHGDVGAAGVPAEQGLVHREQQHVPGRALLAGHPVHLGDQPGRQLEADHVAGAVPERRPRPVGGQRERGDPGQPLPPVAEQPLHPRPAQALGLGPGDVGVLQWRRVHGLAPVAGVQFAQQHVPGPAVHRDVVDHQEQHVLVGPEAGEQGPQRVLLRQVQRARQLPVEQLLGAARLRPRQPGAARRVHHGYGLPVDGREAGAQHLVPVHDAGQRALQGRDVEGAADAQGQREQRLGGASAELVEEPQPPLRERHSVTVTYDVAGFAAVPRRSAVRCDNLHCGPPSGVFLNTAVCGDPSVGKKTQLRTQPPGGRTRNGGPARPVALPCAPPVRVAPWVWPCRSRQPVQPSSTATKRSSEV